MSACGRGTLLRVWVEQPSTARSCFIICSLIVQGLKIHKIENFFGFDFGISVFLFLSYVKILRFYKKTFYWTIIGGDMIFPLSLRLSGIEFSLVSD
jgi:hypothetical protein